MNRATRSLIHRWFREDVRPDGIQRRRALLAHDRRERASTKRHQWLETRMRDWATKADNWATKADNWAARNRDLVDKLKALHDRVPVYTRIQQDERYFGRTFVVPISFNPDAVVKWLVFSSADRDQRLDLEREFHYLVQFASEKILETLREAAAEYLGMPGRPR